MAIQVICPDCQTTYRLADEYTGKKVRCKKCAAMFMVELPSEAGAIAADQAEFGKPG